MNGARGECVGLYQITTRKGVRASAATAFLRPALRRANLRVVTGGARDANPLRRAAGDRRRVCPPRPERARRRRGAR